jgi:hypothetical protein
MLGMRGVGQKTPLWNKAKPPEIILRPLGSLQYTAERTYRQCITPTMVVDHSTSAVRVPIDSRRPFPTTIGKPIPFQSTDEGVDRGIA